MIRFYKGEIKEGIKYKYLKGYLGEVMVRFLVVIVELNFGLFRVGFNDWSVFILFLVFGIIDLGKINNFIFFGFWFELLFFIFIVYDWG